MPDFSLLNTRPWRLISQRVDCAFKPTEKLNNNILNALTSAKLISSIPLMGPEAPALLNKQSIRPNLSTEISIIFFTSDSFVTSVWMKTALSPEPTGHRVAFFGRSTGDNYGRLLFRKDFSGSLTDSTGSTCNYRDFFFRVFFT